MFVEVVRDTPCQGPDRFHLLHLDQLLFEQAPFRDVDPGHDDGDDRPGAVVQRGMVPRDRPRRSVGGDDRGFERWRRAPAATARMASRWRSRADSSISRSHILFPRASAAAIPVASSHCRLKSRISPPRLTCRTSAPEMSSIRFREVALLPELPENPRPLGHVAKDGPSRGGLAASGRTCRSCPPWAPR